MPMTWASSSCASRSRSGSPASMTRHRVELASASELMAQYGEEAGLSERVLEALTEYGVETVGELMDLYVHGESQDDQGYRRLWRRGHG